MSERFADHYSAEDVSQEECSIPALRIALCNSGDNIYDFIRNPEHCKALLDTMRAEERHVLFYALTESDSKNDPSYDTIRHSDDLADPTELSFVEDMLQAIQLAAHDNADVTLSLDLWKQHFDIADGEALKTPEDITLYMQSLNICGDAGPIFHSIDEHNARIASVPWKDSYDKIVLVDNDIVMHRRGTPYNSQTSFSPVDMWHIDKYPAYPTNIIFAMRQTNANENRVDRLWLDTEETL